MMNVAQGAEGFAYPEIENDVIDDVTPKSEAIYIPSVSVGYAKDALLFRSLRDDPPSHLPENVLNIMDPMNEVFRLSHAMISYGQFKDKNAPTIFTKRDRFRTRVIGDSGGYQWAGDKMRFDNDGERQASLEWLEANCDIAMTLDAPPTRLGKEKCPFTGFQDCLDLTRACLSVFESKRSNSNTMLLNVIHGATARECVYWYKSVRIYQFEGYAFGGPLRTDIYHLLRMLILMEEEGDLAKTKWIHLLGTANLKTAVMLTAIQRGIKERLGYNIRFSFDTSTPFRMMKGNGVFGLPTLTDTEMKVEQFNAPAGHFYHNKRVLWPWPSRLGEIMYVNDVVTPCGLKNGMQRDRLGNHLLALHNLQALCFAVRNANRVFDATLVIGHQEGKRQVGNQELKAIEAIDAVLRNPKMKNLEAYLPIFAEVSKHQKDEMSAYDLDDQREYDSDWFD